MAVFFAALILLQVKPHSSPLIAACDDKYVQVVQLLIKNGANIDYQDSVCNYLHCFRNTWLKVFPIEW